MRVRRIPLDVKSLVLAAVVSVSTLAFVTSTTSPSVSALTSGIVATNLALNLDPNLSESYPGSGTSVLDLSPAGRTGTLAGSPLPVLDSSGPKSFEFPGPT